MDRGEYHDAVSEPSRDTGSTDAIGQEHSASDEARVHRVQALGALARDRDASTVAPASTSSSGTHVVASGVGRRWRFRVAGIALVLLGIVAGVLGYILLPRAASIVAPRAPDRLTIDLHGSGYSCPSALAWAPDGTRVAVVAQRGPCNQQFPMASYDAVLIYDSIHGDASHNARLLRILDPLPTLTAAHGIISTPSISWSPDGTRVALQVLIEPPAVGSAHPPAYSALLLLPVAGGNPALSPAPQVIPGSAVIWDTTTATPTGALTYPLPQALSYQWTSDGHLTVGQPVPASLAPDTYLSSSVAWPHDHMVPLWAAGALIPIYPDPTRPSASTVVTLFGANVSAWSPDGRYVAPHLEFAAPLPAAADALRLLTPNSCSVISSAPCADHPLPYPDKALQSIATRLVPQPLQNVVPVAWRPDGKVLATILPGEGIGAADEVVHVSLVMTATGETANVLSVDSRSQDYAIGSYAVLQWSPTGRQLAFMDTFGSRVTLWGESVLPH